MQGIACNVVDNAISLSSRVGQLGLPCLIQNNYFSQNNSIAYTGCYTDIYYFSLSDTSSIASVLWNFDDPASGANNTSALLNPSHTFSSPGVYHVSATVTYASAFVDTLFQSVNITAAPDLFAYDSLFFCLGSSVQIQPDSTYNSYLWSTGDTTYSTTINSSSTYSLQVSDINGCNILDSVYAYFGDTVVLNIDTTFCAGTPFSFNGQIINIAGDYYFNYISAGGCDSIVALHIAEKYPPTVILPADTNICLGETIAIYPIINGQYNSFNWNDAYTTLNRFITTEGLYVIEVENECGTSSDDIWVLLDDCESNIWFPNFISPNGDGYNDVFSYAYENIFEFHIIIFNRWGNKVFESNDILENWDGNSNGRECSEGVYFWIADHSLYKNNTIQTETSHGSLTLYR